MIKEPILIISVKCKKCSCEMILKNIYIDLMHCSFLLETYCISCDDFQVFELSLEDFIELDKLINDGGNNEKK